MSPLLFIPFRLVKESWAIPKPCGLEAATRRMHIYVDD
jgi:hypothetical protein